MRANETRSHELGDETMTAERINASRKYQAALRVVKSAELGSDLAAWEAADAALSDARKALVAAEAKWPTKAESNRERRELDRGNRGLRINA
jgi:hypothetical protein